SPFDGPTCTQLTWPTCGTTSPTGGPICTWFTTTPFDGPTCTWFTTTPFDGPTCTWFTTTPFGGPSCTWFTTCQAGNAFDGYCVARAMASKFWKNWPFTELVVPFVRVDGRLVKSSPVNSAWAAESCRKVI